MKKGSKYGVLAVLGLIPGYVCAAQVQPSVFDQGLQQIRWQYSVSAYGDSEDSALADAPGARSGSGKPAPLKRRSAGKAFALSLVVPGWGQYYYGSRTKPFLFLGAEIAAWALHIKWHNDGEDKTVQFEAYADENWKEQRYSDYLWEAYDVHDDDSLETGTPGMTHHLPDTKTQQYYEMIGKYHQFSWGWVDAYANGDPGDTLYSLTYTPEIITLGAPYSAYREHYMTLRNEANDAFDRANRMIVVSIANRVISAFEAYFVTRSMNRRAEDQSSMFGRVRMKAELKSYGALHDTPFLNVSYRF